MKDAEQLYKWAVKGIYLVFITIKVGAYAIIFPGYRSTEMFYFSIGLFVLSAMPALASALPSFMDWRGTAVAVAIFGILALLERRNNK